MDSFLLIFRTILINALRKNIDKIPLTQENVFIVVHLKAINLFIVKMCKLFSIK